MATLAVLAVNSTLFKLFTTHGQNKSGRRRYTIYAGYAFRRDETTVYPNAVDTADIEMSQSWNHSI